MDYLQPNHLNCVNYSGFCANRNLNLSSTGRGSLDVYIP